MLASVSRLHRPINAICDVPGSRSQTNRALLLGALSNGISHLTHVLFSEDTYAFRDALMGLGFDVVTNETARTMSIVGHGGRVPRDDATVWTESAGTAARFLLALCASQEGRFDFDGSEQMRRRPVGPLVSALTNLGARFEPAAADTLPIKVWASGLSGGSISDVGALKSSQFASALLMVGPLARSPLEIDLKGLISRPFVDMTLRMMERFGVQVVEDGDRVCVPDNQRYKCAEFAIEPDASTASYFYAAAAISGGTVVTPGLWKSRSIQGDIAFLGVLEEMGCEVGETEEGIEIKAPPRLKAIDVDMNRISDTFMTLAAIAPFAAGTTRIRRIGHTRLQESDRIASMEEGLLRLGVGVRSGPDWIEIEESVPRPATVDSHGDHRVAMSFAVLGLRCPGVTIENAECVSKTCPDFFERLNAL